MLSEFNEYNFLCHHGILGMKWGIRRYQNPDGSLTSAGRARYGSGRKVFVSGSSKTQDKTSGYYRKKLPSNIKSAIDSKMKNGDTILVGDAPGIDRQVQDYLKKNKYKHVTVYATGDEPRYLANKKWETKLIDGAGHKPGTPEFNRQKDIAMTNDADEGIAVVLDKGGAKATRDNVDRLVKQNKDVSIYEINRYGFEMRLSYDEMKKPVYGTHEYDSYVKENAKKLESGLKRMSDLKSYTDNKAMQDPKTRHEWRDAADLGLKALDEYDDNMTKEELNAARTWFLYEDQTIGKPEIAAMFNRGYKVSEIKELVNNAGAAGTSYDFDMDTQFAKQFRFGVAEGYNLDEFIDRCEEVKKR